MNSDIQFLKCYTCLCDHFAYEDCDRVKLSLLYNCIFTVSKYVKEEIKSISGAIWHACAVLEILACL